MEGKKQFHGNKRPQNTPLWDSTVKTSYKNALGLSRVKSSSDKLAVMPLNEMERWLAVKKLRQSVRQACGVPALLAYERWCARSSLPAAFIKDDDDDDGESGAKEDVGSGAMATVVSYLVPNSDPEKGLQKDLMRLGGLSEEDAQEAAAKCVALGVRLNAKLNDTTVEGSGKGSETAVQGDDDMENEGVITDAATSTDTNGSDVVANKDTEPNNTPAKKKKADVKNKLRSIGVRVEGDDDDTHSTHQAQVEERGALLAYSLRTKKKPFFSLSRPHAAKLRSLYARTRGGKWVDKEGSDNDRFVDAVFCVLARYDALGGAGYQAALNEASFDVLKDKMRVDCECFASPLNCRYGQFCSAFPDTDSPFGSLGSFFDFYPSKGSFEMNPPFVPEVLCAAAEHANALLSLTKEPLSFVVVVPAWKEVRMWQVLSNSAYNKHEPLILTASNHGYCDGQQHQRRPSERYRVSSYDTAVFFLQNDAGAKKWPVSEAIRNELVESMHKAVGSAKTVQELEGRYRPNKEGDDPNMEGGDAGDGSRKRKGGRVFLLQKKRKANEDQ